MTNRSGYGAVSAQVDRTTGLLPPVHGEQPAFYAFFAYFVVRDLLRSLI